MSLSPSGLSMLLSCPRKYFHTYEQGLQPEKKSWSLTFGSLVHTVFELWRGGQSPDEAFFSGTKDMPAPPKKDMRTKAKLRLLFDNYRDFYKNDGLVLVADPDTGKPATEWKFNVMIPELEESVPGIIDYTAQWDANEKKGKELWLFDYKTTTRLELDWVKQYRVSNQFKAYAWIGMGKYPEIAGIVCDLMRITAGNKKGKTKYERDGTMFYRLPIRYTSDALNEWRANMASGQALKKIYKSSGYWPQNAPDACKAYGSSCPFLDICDTQDEEIREVIIQGFPKREEKKDVDSHSD